MAKKAPELRTKQNEKDRQWRTTLLGRNGKKVLLTGIMNNRKFTDKDRKRLIELLETAVIITVPAKKKKDA